MKTVDDAIEERKHAAALQRMKRKGGTASFSLSKGSYIHVNGEKPYLVNPPMPEMVGTLTRKPPKVILL